ncbi:MAG: diguanylate cyclase [Planctomycetota bacterium]
MAIIKVINKFRLRSIGYLGYGFLVVVIAGSLAVLQSIQTDYEKELFESTAAIRRLTESFAEFRVLAARRESDLYEYLLKGNGESLRRYRNAAGKLVEDSLKLVAVAGTFRDHDLSARLAEIIRIEDQWTKQFAEPAIAWRMAHDKDIVPAELLDEHSDYAEQLDLAIARLDNDIVSRWEDFVVTGEVSLQKRQLWLIGIITAILFSGGILVWFLIRAIVQPIAELNRVTQRVVRNGPVDPPKPKGVFELRQLFANFSAMVRSLKEREAQLLESQADTARTNQELLVVNEYAKYLQQVQNEEDIGHALIRQIRRISRVNQVGLYLRHRMHPTFELVASYPPIDSNELKLERSLTSESCSVVQSHKRVHVLDSHKELSASCQLGCSNFRSEFCVPLASHGEVIGMLHLSSEVPVGWSKHVIQLVTSLANFTAPAVSNLRSLENMWERATRDPLTTLYNRRYLEEFLPMLLEGARRQRSATSLLLCDIDHFKGINDTQGHDAGDRVLRTLAQTLRDSVRASDVVCRYGGEEFVILLPQTDESGAMIIADKLRQRVAERCQRGDAREPVTISIGVSVFPHHGEEYAELIKAADLALYRAKARGRNCCELFQAPPSAANAAPILNIRP